MPGKIVIMGGFALAFCILMLMFVSYSEVKSVKDEAMVRDMISHFDRYQADENKLPRDIDALVGKKYLSSSAKNSVLAQESFKLVALYWMTHKTKPDDIAIRDMIEQLSHVVVPADSIVSPETPAEAN